MQNVISNWRALDMRRRIAVAGATLLVLVAMLALARTGGSTQMALLYSGLEPRAAGEVVAALEQRGIPHEVRGASIHVDALRRDSLRMELAAEGLPAAGDAGYELLDQLSGFGTTSQMFDAAYWRAREGELARTILAVPGVRSARVHISRGGGDPFRRDIRPTASVTVATAAGALPEDRARALRHLVASAVAGMRPEDVQVIDAAGGLVAPPGEGEGVGSTAALARAEEIRRSVERLLAARVGSGRSVVEVSVELVTDREMISERLLDPQGRVAISSESETSSRQGTEGGGEVTVASNLPEGDATGGGGNRSNASETRERVNFEVSETQREVTRNPGGIRRLSVAVLVDGQSATAADGSRSWAPRDEAELLALRELVASAVGLDEARGDVLTLKSLEFQVPTELGTAAEQGYPGFFGPLDTMALLRLAMLTLVALALVLLVLRPMLAGRKPTLQQMAGPAPAVGLPGPEIAGSSAVIPAGGATAALTGEITDDFGLPDLPVVDFMGVPGIAGEDPAARLRRLIEERQAETMEILRSWLDPEEERA